MQNTAQQEEQHEMSDKEFISMLKKWEERGERITVNPCFIASVVRRMESLMHKKSK